MITTDLNKVELTEFSVHTKPGQRCKATFPLFAAHGTNDSATVYFELRSGDFLGTHTDSAEELLYIVEGEVEVSVGEEAGMLSKGQLAVVPKLMPHSVKNIGNETAKVLGFFGGANNVVSIFEEVWQPIGSNMVDTSKMV
jgi:quercetin dioxygenase-like cupin family protein